MAAIPENRVFGIDAVRLSVDPAEHPWGQAERAAIEAWLANHDTCPWCRGATDGALTPNAALRAAIRRWEPGGAGC